MSVRKSLTLSWFLLSLNLDCNGLALSVVKTSGNECEMPGLGVPEVALGVQSLPGAQEKHIP